MATTSGKQSLQTRPQVSERVRKEVERQLPVLVHMSHDELLAKVGEIPASNRLYEQSVFLDFPDLRQLGENFLNDRVRPIVCEVDDLKIIGDAVSTDNVSALVGLLLPVFGLGVATGAVVAIAVIVLKIGLHQYCKDYKAPAKTTTRTLKSGG